MFAQVQQHVWTSFEHFGQHTLAFKNRFQETYAVSEAQCTCMQATVVPILIAGAVN